MTTKQESVWKGEFGDEYNKRNDMTPGQVNEHYRRLYGFSRLELEDFMLNGYEYLGPNSKVLEVGCGTGNIMRFFHKSMITGIDTNEAAVKIAKERGLNAQGGSAFDLPYPDENFDLVFTSGLLIHIKPDDWKRVISEMVRVSKKYIWGFEYFGGKPDWEEIKYRGKENMLWKANWTRIILEDFHLNLRLVREIRLVRLDGSGVDTTFLLEKIK